MKQFLIKITACLLVCLMLGSMLASCTPPEDPYETDTGTGNETEADGTEADSGKDTEADGGKDTEADGGKDTEADGGKDTEADGSDDTEAEGESDEDSETGSHNETDTETETETYETIPGIDYSPIEFEKRPDCTINESIIRDMLEPVDILVEGEDYFSSTLENIKTDLLPSRSGGSAFFAVWTPDEWKKDNPEDVEWDIPLTVTYKVDIPYSGYYKIKTAASDMNKSWTSNFSIVIDGEKTLVGTNGKILEEPTESDSLETLIQLVDQGIVYLKKGVRTFKFVLDLQDALVKDRDAERWKYGRASFQMDYFTLSRAYSDNDSPKIGYGVDISTNEDADILSDAAKVFVLDGSYPITIDYVHFFEEKGTGNYTITDFDGKVIARKYFNGEKNDIVKVKIDIKDHPTGYFKMIAGNYVVYYVVTPSFADTKKLTDTPFAMDFAANSLIGKLDYIAAYSAALRMSGVTWVRERGSWYCLSSFEDGVPTYNESYIAKVKNTYSVINKTGLNILAMLSGTPSWALQMVQDRNSELAWNNYKGFYGTQLASYYSAKKWATELNGIVKVIEFENETDHGSRDTAELYASWLKAAAIGVIDSGADIKISLAGLCRTLSQRDYTPLIMSSNIMKYCSVFNYHSHMFMPGNNTTPDYGAGSPLPTQYAANVILYGIEQPVWLTESGMKLPSTTPTDTHKARQAPYLVSSTVQSLAYGTDKHFWFVASPYLENGGDFGSFTPEHQPYPTIAAQAVMTHVLGEGKYIGELKGLADNARGYLFNTGDRVAAVLWTNKLTAKYTFKTDLPVIMTTMMGQQTLLEPVDGEITVNLSLNPIYITYSTPPTDYFKHSYAPAELKMPEISSGDRVVITPEFEDHIFDIETKDNGHNVKDGTVINVRVINYNNVAVTGKVSVSIPGFTVSGIDTEVTVEPYAEKFVTLTLHKEGNVVFDDHVIFTGTFNGVECSPTAVHVYTEINENELRYSYGNTLRIDRKTDDACLENISINVQNFDGSVIMRMNEDVYEDFKFENNTISMDLSDLAPGKYIFTIGFVSKGGNLEQTIHLTLRYDGEFVVFREKW